MNANDKNSTEAEVEIKTEHATVTHGKHGHHETVKVFLEPDDLVKSQVGGFVTFLREHAVVGVAIGFIIGLQAQTLVKQLVTSFITPLLTLAVGPKMQNKTFVIGQGQHAVSFPWGQFAYALADFLVVLLCIYAVVKLLKLDKFDKPVNTK
jgi:large-conductance mechanosensitive channel